MVCWHRLAHTEDEAKAHVANSTMEILQELFGDHIISQNLWPPRPLDLSHLSSVYEDV